MDKKIVVNPSVVLREEFDDWALLFDPDSGKVFGINPVSVFIWKNLDGHHTIEDIISNLTQNCENVPESVTHDVNEFIDELVKKGLAGFES